MAENAKFPFPPLPPFGRPPELKSIADTAPSMIRSIIYGIKTIDQSIAAVDNAIKAMDALMIGTDTLAAVDNAIKAMDALMIGTDTLVSEIASTDEAISALKQAEQSLNPDLIEKAIKFFVKSKSECPIAEYLSLALTYSKYGDKEKARQIIRKVVKFLEGGGRRGERKEKLV